MELLQLYERNFPNNIQPLDVARELLSNPKNHILERRNSNGTLIAAVVIYDTTIILLCVDEPYRKQGLGSSLLLEAELWIASQGTPSVNIGECYEYLTPGVPIQGDNVHFFEKRGYTHSWGDTECFDMAMSLSHPLSYTEQLDDTIEGISYHIASYNDLPGITACAKNAEPDFLPYYQSDDLYKNNPHQRVLVAMTNGFVCGTLIVSSDVDTGTVGCTATHTDYRGRSIATNLVKIGTKYLQELGCSSAVLSYTYSGLDKLYGKAGYHITTRYMLAEKQLG